MAGKPVKIAILADAREAVRGFDSAGAAAQDAGRKFDGVAEKSDQLASASSQTAGGLGDLGGALSGLPGPLGKFGSAMEASQVAIMGVTGAADLMNVVTEKFPNLFGSASRAGRILAATKRALGVATRFALGPWGLLIAGLALMAVGMVALWKKSDTFRGIVTGAFEAIAAAGRWMWNNVLQPVFRLLVLGLSGVMSMWASMLRGLSKVPGFGWAKTAADKMGGAADKARAIADNMQKIKDQGEVNVKVNTRDLAEAKRLSDAIVANLDEILRNNGLGVLAGLGGNGRVIAAGTPINLKVSVPATANPAETGREIAKSLGAYFRTGGRLALP